MWPADGSEHAPPSDGGEHHAPGDVPPAAEAVTPPGGPFHLDLTSLPEVIGFEVTRILDAARIAGEQIKSQALDEAREARSEAVQAGHEAAQAHEEARLAREDADRARGEAGSMRSRIARLQAEFTGLLREMEPLSDTTPSPTEPAEADVPGSPRPSAQAWSPAWGITEAEGHGGDVARPAEPGPDRPNGHEEPANEGSTVVVPEAADAGEPEGDRPGGIEGSPEDTEATQPTGDPTGDADDDVPVLERLRRLSPS
jgi:hypothetical protein